MGGTAVYPEAPVVKGVPAYAAPVVHAAPVYHAAPVVAHAAPAYHAAPVVAHPVIAHGPVVAAGYHGRPAGQVSHQSVSKPYQGEHRSTTQSKAFGAAVAAVADSPNRLHGARGVVAHPIAHGFGHGVAHAVAHPVAHAVAHPVAHAPIYHAAPAYHAPVVHAAPAYHAQAYPDEPSPYTYTYAVADDYSNVNFNADGYEGYVADVTYEGTAAYPVAVAPAYHAAPVCSCCSRLSRLTQFPLKT